MIVHCSQNPKKTIRNGVKVAIPLRVKTNLGKLLGNGVFGVVTFGRQRGGGWSLIESLREGREGFKKYITDTTKGLTL